MKNQIAMPQPNAWSPSFCPTKFRAEAWADGEHAAQQPEGRYDMFEERDRDDADLMAQRMEPPAG